MVLSHPLRRGVIGYLTRTLDAVTRMLFFATGFALMTPANVFEGGTWTDIAGLVVAVLLFGREFQAGRRLRANSRKGRVGGNV